MIMLTTIAVATLTADATTIMIMMTTIVVATALAAWGAYAAALLRYGETEPFTGRTYLAFLSHREVQEYEEARFAEFKERHASEILDSSDPDTVRVCNIAQDILRTVRHGLALMAARRPRRQHIADELDWMDMLDWEVIVIRDEDGDVSCYPGAGKIIVATGSLHSDTDDGSIHRLKTDAEVAAALAHEVGHVVARHTSRIPRWLRLILLFPILRLFLLPYIRRDELEADHIGILLLAAAGVDPHITLQDWWDKANMERDPTLVKCLRSTHPSHKKRWQFLSQPKVMDEAMELYRQVTGHAQGWPNLACSW